MSSMVNPKILRPHPKNQEYYSDLTGPDYDMLKRSIEVGGIRDPLWVLPDYTLIRGHQRLRIALEIGLEKVPVQVKDVSAEEAEYLMIADNEERRVDDDPIRKAKRARFLAEYWNVRLGKGGDKTSTFIATDKMSVAMKNLEAVTQAIGEDERTTRRLLKLNDLIPELQALVSAGKLGTTAAEQLAHLTPEVQRDLHRAMGASLADLTVAEAKDLRRKLDEHARIEAALKAKIAELEARKPQVQVVEKPVQDPAVLAKLAEKDRQLAEINKRLAELESEQSLRELKRQKAQLEDEISNLTRTKHEIAEAASEAERDHKRALAFHAALRRAMKPIKDEWGNLELLLKQCHVEACDAKEIEAYAKLLRTIADTLDAHLDMVDGQYLTVENGKPVVATFSRNPIVIDIAEEA